MIEFLETRMLEAKNLAIHLTATDLEVGVRGQVEGFDDTLVERASLESSGTETGFGGVLLP